MAKHKKSFAAHQVERARQSDAPQETVAANDQQAMVDQPTQVEDQATVVNESPADKHTPDQSEHDGSNVERQSQIATILIGLLIIASGLLIYNYFQNTTAPATTKTVDEQQVNQNAGQTTPTPTPSAAATVKPTTTPTKTATKPSTTPTPNPTTKPSATPTPAVASNTNASSYTVVAGDTLWGIAEKVYGSGYEWSKLAQDNKLASSDIIEVGQKLSVVKDTSLAQKPASTSEPTKVAQGVGGASVDQTPVTSIKTVEIKHGDTLWSIAEQVYGDGDKWVLITQDPHNKLGRLPDGTPLIHAGNVLYLPQAP
jgi:nucleoid-associated protein YgaU